MKKLLLSLTLLCASLAYGQRDPKMDAFIDDLMSKMTLDEKLGQLNLASGGVPGVGEIMAAAEFYDFDAKYYNAESKTVVDPELPGHAAEDVRKAAVEIFKAVDGYGLSRVDFFVTDAGEVVFNEINTLPGFTAISMYPMLWEAAGISKPELVDRLIDLAFER